jgi:hypothetical protein
MFEIARCSNFAMTFLWVAIFIFELIVVPSNLTKLVLGGTHFIFVASYVSLGIADAATRAIITNLVGADVRSAVMIAKTAPRLHSIACNRTYTSVPRTCHLYNTTIHTSKLVGVFDFRNTFAGTYFNPLF